MKKLCLWWCLIGAAACGKEEQPEADLLACDLIGGTATALTATPGRDTAPKITFGETPYEVTVDPTATTFVGIDVPVAQHGVLFLSAANVATGKLYQGTEELELEAASANPNCAAAIPDHYH